MNIKAKKSLGQNFLQDEEVLNRIIKDANLTSEDLVLEIGPGQAALTEKLAAVCKKVLAVEIDERLLDLLHTKLVGNKNVEIIHGDILKLNLPELVASYGFQDAGYKVVANIPYYITAPIIRLLLETKYPAKEIVLMVQKEVAQRICAQAGEMSILAVSVQYYAKAEYLFTVPKEAFDPIPKVDSAIIRIVCEANRGERNSQEVKKFFRIVKAGFSAKRKTLANNLANSLQLNKKEIEEKLVAMGFGVNVRAQELSVKNWEQLVEKI